MEMGMLLNHGFADKYFRDVIKVSRRIPAKIQGLEYTDHFKLIVKYSKSIPNAIINKSGENCQPTLKDDLLEWKPNCTNAEKGVVKHKRPDALRNQLCIE